MSAAKPVRAEFPHYTTEERAAAFIRGYRDGRDGKAVKSNPYSMLEIGLHEAWKAGRDRARDKVRSHCVELGSSTIVYKLTRPRLIVTWREAVAWAKRSA